MWYTPPLMASCPICAERGAKRHCPARSEAICAVCCATGREVTIDCPGDCPHLRAGHSFESDKRVIDPQLIKRFRQYDDQFLHRFSPALDALSRVVLETRTDYPGLVDQHVVEVTRALSATLRTLSSGIYYDTAPAGGPAAAALFRNAKERLDGWMTPASGDAPPLGVADAQRLIDFWGVLAEMRTSGKPLSRTYLQWLVRVVGERPGESEPKIILP